jgi:hypothetical protein
MAQWHNGTTAQRLKGAGYRAKKDNKTAGQQDRKTPVPHTCFKHFSILFV